MQYRALRQNLAFLKRNVEKEKARYSLRFTSLKSVKHYRGHRRELNGRPKGLYIDLEEVTTAPSGFRDSLVVHGTAMYGKWVQMTSNDLETLENPS